MLGSCRYAGLFAAQKIKVASSWVASSRREFRSKAVREAIRRAASRLCGKEAEMACVVYHYPCFDGVFAALAAYLYHSVLGLPAIFLPNSVADPLSHKFKTLGDFVLCLDVILSDTHVQLPCLGIGALISTIDIAFTHLVSYNVDTYYEVENRAYTLTEETIIMQHTDSSGAMGRQLSFSRRCHHASSHIAGTNGTNNSIKNCWNSLTRRCLAKEDLLRSKRLSERPFDSLKGGQK
eukprot:Gb_19893 [translate_table: standard]